MEDTIAAISTPIGEGGIAIIRVCGPQAFHIANAVFHPHNGRTSEFPSHTIHFGTVQSRGTIFDEVMLSVMRSPRTYTKEDTVEINCHGGLLTARKVLSLCLEAGARIAEPGEFTKRAFLNGRIDLTQAEAVMDLIRAKTDKAHDLAIRELQGHLSAKVNALRDQLLDVLAHLEAYIDFPEDGISPDTRDQLEKKIESAVEGLKSLLATAREGRILRDGIAVAIIGRPNTGKSSILNALLGEDRSIVTPIPGTTRDTIEEIANIHGIPFRLIDTAGIRSARGQIEALGLRRTQAAVQESEIILHVLDASRRYCTADSQIAQRYPGKQIIVALNKSDLPKRLRPPLQLQKLKPLPVSAKTGQGIELLCRALADAAFSGMVGNSQHGVALNERHHQSLARASDLLTTAQHLFSTDSPIEIISQQLRAAIDAVGEVTVKQSPMTS